MFHAWFHAYSAWITTGERKSLVSFVKQITETTLQQEVGGAGTSEQIITRQNRADGPRAHKSAFFNHNPSKKRPTESHGPAEREGARDPIIIILCVLMMAVRSSIGDPEPMSVPDVVRPFVKV